MAAVVTAINDNAVLTKKTLTVLDISGNVLDDAGGRAVTALLQNTCSLQRLYFCDMEFIRSTLFGTKDKVAMIVDACISNDNNAEFMLDFRCTLSSLLRFQTHVKPSNQHTFS